MMKTKGETFVTIFPNYQDFHFFKDPGQLPFRFSHLGYKSRIVCYGRMKSLKITEKNVPIVKIPSCYITRKFVIGLLIFLIFNSRGITILNLFHLTRQSLLLAFVYKMINPRGFVYLKMDSCHFEETYQWEYDLLQKLNNSGTLHGIRSRKKVFNNYLASEYMINKVDLWSVEDNYSRDYYENSYPVFGGRLITVYNGHTGDLPDAEEPKDFGNKENIIISVGRLGTYQKATEVLLEAFSLIATRIDYNLHFAGTIEPDFDDYIKNYFIRNPDLVNRVFFHGSLARMKLNNLYNRSKILCMPSRFEGMAIVFPEAMYYTNAILTTQLVSIRDLITKYNFGLVVRKDSPVDLAEALLKLTENEIQTRTFACNAHLYSENEFSWDQIVIKLEKEIESRMLTNS